LYDKISGTEEVARLMERELKRGTIEMLLLQLLEEREMYGYELVSELQARSGGEPEWVTPERGVPRKYYRSTEAGRAELERLVAEWEKFTAGVDAVLGRKDGGR
jgi:PadR family transcriptional regulator PadR